MQKSIISSGTLALCFTLLLTGQDRPNVIFIMSDDMNDWVGPFGGNPQVSTPNMDKLYREGGMVFNNTHVPGPICGPSRSAMLSGFRPETTGCYGNDHNMRTSSLVQQYATLPEYFSKYGYITISRGKIFHSHHTEKGIDHGHWAYDIWEPNSGSWAIQNDKLYSRSQGIYNGVKMENIKYEGGSPGNELQWAPTIGEKDQTPDYRTALWFAEQLQKDYDKPFFMAVGIYRPHLPWYVPQEYFDRYEADSIKIPEYKLDDLDDILRPGGEKRFSPTGDFLWASQDEYLHKLAVRAYMASVSYADDCMGVVLNALENSKYKGNTIIIIMGDHGWHLGEKLKFGKASLWSEATRTPLIIKTPDMKKPSICKRVVNLMDLYPTLIDICGLPEKDVLDGRSFSPLLNNPKKEWPYPSITALNTSFTANNEEWRYTLYNDGTEELYNLKADPMEWNNLITSKDPEALQAKSILKEWIPKNPAPPLPINHIDRRSPGIIRTPDMTIKQGRPLNTLK